MLQEALPESEKKFYRERLSRLIVLVSILGVICISGIVIFLHHSKFEAVQLVFSAVLPLFGVWIGTILAFYFGKENFEAATRSVTEIARTVSPLERLEEISAKDKMILRSEMMVETAPVDRIKIADILERTKEKKRLPILNEKGNVLLIIHRSAIAEYMASKALRQTGVDFKDFTLFDLLQENADLKRLFEESFGIVDERASLAKVKVLMDAIPRCQDIFITRGGGKEEPVIGWVTNVIIQEVGRV
jgi:hypothetical protein